ncbi:hypothetical protein A8C56_09300 [Niabella ginsenosidivorans]|uniref:Uncharacterized protein n=1 Tax=Niabella ginsenosidivorans TaxID=1176587 RepID=A0A1A9I0G1_9BACT|nr:hypothetical protein A8C56_09300 [Niabella ginsenosidivorans]
MALNSLTIPFTCGISSGVFYKKQADGLLLRRLLYSPVQQQCSNYVTAGVIVMKALHKKKDPSAPQSSLERSKRQHPVLSF